MLAVADNYWPNGNASCVGELVRAERVHAGTCPLDGAEAEAKATPALEGDT